MRNSVLRHIIAASTGLAILALGGCSTTVPPGFTSVDYQKPPRDIVKVEERHTTQSVFIAPRNGALSPSERGRIDAFVADFGGDRPESVHVELHGSGPSELFTGVIDELMAQGVERGKIRLFPGERASGANGVRPNTVVMAASRAIAVSPDCPGWVDHESAPNDNRPDANFGCSNVSNLGAMVADPADFAKGRSQPYSDADPAISAVQRYETDKVKALPVQTNFSATGGGASGGGGGGGGGGGAGGAAQ